MLGRAATPLRRLKRTLVDGLPAASPRARELGAARDVPGVLRAVRGVATDLEQRLTAAEAELDAAHDEARQQLEAARHRLLRGLEPRAALHAAVRARRRGGLLRERLDHLSGRLSDLLLVEECLERAVLAGRVLQEEELGALVRHLQEPVLPARSASDSRQRAQDLLEVAALEDQLREELAAPAGGEIRVRARSRRPSVKVRPRIQVELPAPRKQPSGRIRPLGLGLFLAGLAGLML